eukprot:CAMPEP_0113939172 /NCGR_PEP_ID=MMETSP1339-20121228/5534_1 /TAXON_ID=94617 /ORGANISM="Fibrocapsa japonica" /LENGTH=477 /DNA_ID=CAMNT_0000942595 /DNA_START=134 /DNA_END=1567 /DNA_ORIENTATION=+ /assembly_acc=CAM_ASM_000762
MPEAYFPEETPDTTKVLDLEEDIGESVLVSGFLKDKDSTDQFVFDVLHDQGVWKKIVACSSDVASAKKRLISRQSRYSGLSDVLDFAEAEALDEEKMKEILKDVDSWLCYCDESELMKQVEIAKASDLKCLTVVCEAPTYSPHVKGAVAALEASDLRYTFVRVDGVRDGPEGESLAVKSWDEEIQHEGKFPTEITRDDLVRTTAESFVIPKTKNRAISLLGGSNVNMKYLKYLRGQGATRRQEIGELMTDKFDKAMSKVVEEKDEEEKEKNFVYTEDELEEMRKAMLGDWMRFKKEWIERNENRKKRALIMADWAADDFWRYNIAGTEEAKDIRMLDFRMNNREEFSQFGFLMTFHYDRSFKRHMFTKLKVESKEDFLNRFDEELPWDLPMTEEDFDGYKNEIWTDKDVGLWKCERTADGYKDWALDEDDLLKGYTEAEKNLSPEEYKAFSNLMNMMKGKPRNWDIPADAQANPKYV